MEIEFKVVLTDGRVAWEEIHTIEDFENFRATFKKFDEFAKYQQEVIGQTGGIVAELIHPHNINNLMTIKKWTEKVVDELFSKELQKE